MHWLYYAILLVFLVASVAINLFTLPGNWVMLLATCLYGWMTGWQYIGLRWILTLLVIAAAGELVEFLAAGKVAAKVGGSRWGALGAMAGGLVGGVFLTGLVPIPVIGTLAGILIGTFIGSSLIEMATGKRIVHSLRIGAGATRGRLYGTVLKILFGLVILFLAVIAALPL